MHHFGFSWIFSTTVTTMCVSVLWVLRYTHTLCSWDLCARDKPYNRVWRELHIVVKLKAFTHAFHPNMPSTVRYQQVLQVSNYSQHYVLYLFTRGSIQLPHLLPRTQVQSCFDSCLHLTSWYFVFFFFIFMCALLIFGGGKKRC